MEEFMDTYFHTDGVQEQMNTIDLLPRMLRARWTSELEQDLMMVHGIKPPPIDHFKDNEDIFKI
jgi:hypothetical protein